jgi:hypothetical protein
VVTGVSGVVITYKPGVIRLTEDLPEDDLRRGDTILTYTYRGEGFSAAWFKGRFYREYDITFAKWPDGSGCLGKDCAANYVDLGEKVWWAKVKMSSGVVGWVNMNDAKFREVDQFRLCCAGFAHPKKLGGVLSRPTKPKCFEITPSLAALSRVPAAIPA